MSFLKQDNTKAQEGFSLLPAGEYEVFAQKRRIDTANSGTPLTEFTFVVRNDVEQEGKGRKIFHTFYHTENTQGMVFGFNKAIGVPDGTSFDSQESWADYIIAKPVRAYVGTEKWEHNGKKGEKNVIKSFKTSQANGVIAADQMEDKPKNNPSSAPSNANVSNDPFANNGGTIDISDDDLPF